MVSLPLSNIKPDDDDGMLKFETGVSASTQGLQPLLAAYVIAYQIVTDILSFEA